MQNHEAKNERIAFETNIETTPPGVLALEVFNGRREPRPSKHLDDIKEVELPITVEETALCNLLVEKVSSFYKGVTGRDFAKFSTLNVHILSQEEYKRIAGVITKGHFETQSQQTILNGDIVRQTPLHFASTICHELVHQYAEHVIGSLVDNEDKKLGYVIDKVGLCQTYDVPEKRAFAGMEEALVIETQRYLIDNLIQQGLFKETMPALYDPKEIEKVQRYIADNHLMKNNIIYIGGDKPEQSVGFAYEDQRVVLSCILRDVAAFFGADMSRDKVFAILNKARILGQADQLEKLLVDMYGKELADRIKFMSDFNMDQTLLDYMIKNPLKVKSRG